MTIRELKDIIREDKMLCFYEPRYGRNKFGDVEISHFKILVSATNAVTIARASIWLNPHYHKKNLPAYKLLDYFMTNHGARVVEDETND